MPAEPAGAGGPVLTCVGADVAPEQPGPGEGFAAEAAEAGQGVGADVHLQGAQAGVRPGAVLAAEAPPPRGQVEGLGVLQGGAWAAGAHQDGGNLGVGGQREGEAGEEAAVVLQAGGSRECRGLVAAGGEQPPTVTQADELCGSRERG